MTQLPQPTVGVKLCHAQTVPKHLVHRRALAEVFPTDSVTDGECVLIACQLPVGHALYNDRVQPFVDPLLVLEAARQSAILSCLRHLGAAADACFVVRSAELHIHHPLGFTPGDAPRDVVFRCRPRQLRTRDGMLAGGELHLTLYADGSPCASVFFAFAALTPESNHLLRAPGRNRSAGYTPGASAALAPFDASLLGRRNPENVVIAIPHADTPHELPVIVRTDHPGFFDHPLDHVSAAVLVEAGRQAAHAACCTPPARCDLASLRADFTAFAELGIPLFAHVADAPACDHNDSTIRVTLHQLGAPLATVEVTLRSTTGH